MSKLLEKLSLKLWSDAQQRQAFIQALIDPQPFHPCILWVTERSHQSCFQTIPPLSWQPSCVDRLAVDDRPGKHPLHQQGAYYCLDFSSVFAATTLTAVSSTPQVVLDLCAAPGGKSLLAWRLLHPHLLLSNEVIGKRVGRLISNLKRCQVHPVQVLSADPRSLADHMAQVADVVLVDAPCTGQSLLAKGEAAPGCFHPVSIQHNAKRQRRILANAAELVVPGGYIAYMTCAFSEAEDERVCAWFLRKFPEFEPQHVSLLQDFQSHLTDMPCYRMWPQSRLGAGAFTILFRKRPENVRWSKTDRRSSHPQPNPWLQTHYRWRSHRNKEK
ncbi:RsmB/NOP family class I SAM-dependent RNA methyltransferase [Acaryochloris sp. IP29b_bin.148]|uniref:RsmB/NOP family class I SAM-dependent RNA methyltransferase n=1 Tax=Acaryochloris sp. IP29b_bin.148 TaxID=2969218 RepID=UPI003452C567